jgi:CheY-like chemotaxis protein
MNAFKKRALLVVDDSHDDVELLKRAFYKTGWTNPIVTLPNGEDAIDYLVSRLEAGKSEWDSLPVAVLTDLKMPRGDGFQLLQWIRGQAVLDHVLRVVITNSNIETDVQRAFEAGANFFLTKPADYDDFLMFASNFLAWLRLNRYPAEAAPPPNASLLLPATNHRPPVWPESQSVNFITRSKAS